MFRVRTSHGLQYTFMYTARAYIPHRPQTGRKPQRASRLPVSALTPVVCVPGNFMRTEVPRPRFYAFNVRDLQQTTTRAGKGFL
jgi:hypothetical protein